MSKFDLQITSFTPPRLPPPPARPGPQERDTYDIKADMGPDSPHLPLSPLSFTFTVTTSTAAAAKKQKDPLSPATHLQLSYLYQGSGELFVHRPITSADVVPTATTSGDGEAAEFQFSAQPLDIRRGKVNEGQSPDAEVLVRAWRNEKMLGQWTVGVVKGLGFEGFKSDDLSKSRKKVREELKSKAAAK